MKSVESRIKVVLVGPVEWPQNLYMAYALHRAGISVVVLSDIDEPPALRHWLKVENYGLLGGGVFLKLIDKYADDPMVKWIIPLSETAIDVCHDALTADQQSKLLPHLDPGVRRLLNSKSAAGEFAKGLGVSVPLLVRVLSVREALAHSREWGFPVVLKGEAGFAGMTVHICHSESQLRAAWVSLRDQPVFLQQFVDGTNWGVGAFFVNGESSAVQAYEILEQDPPRRGPATKVRISHHPRLIEDARKIAKSLNWTGFMQCDFMRTADGIFYFIEINPRSWGSMTAGKGTGLAVFDALVDYVKGGAVLNLPQSSEDGVVAYTFPKPALCHAESGRTWECLLTLVRPEFWRSAPTLRAGIPAYLLKSGYWLWVKAKRNQAKAAANSIQRDGHDAVSFPTGDPAVNHRIEVYESAEESGARMEDHASDTGLRRGNGF